MKGTKNSGIPIVTGDELKLINEGYSIGQADDGQSIVVLRLSPFTRDVLRPGLASIDLKNSAYRAFAFPIETFLKVRKLVDSFGLDPSYYPAFSILYNEVNLALKANKMRKSKPGKIAALRARFARMDLPKSVTIKYGKKESYTLPNEYIGIFWKAFLFDAKEVNARVSIDIEYHLYRILDQLRIPKKNKYQLMAGLQEITGIEGEFTGGPDAVVKRMEKRVKRQKEKR